MKGPRKETIAKTIRINNIIKAFEEDLNNGVQLKQN